MRARCTNCNAALKYYNRKGFSLSAQRCHCGGSYQRMQTKVEDGAAPLPGYISRLMGREFHKLYTHGKASYLYNRKDDCFIEVPQETVAVPEAAKTEKGNTEILKPML